MSRQAGRHFLQVPGPSNVPERVLLAMARQTIDHRGPDFKHLTRRLLDGFEALFDLADPVVLYPASGTGAWVAALGNCLSAGDRVVGFETGHFATLWRQVAQGLGLEVIFEPGDWRSAADAHRLAQILAADKDKSIKAVCVVHNETSTGVTSDIGAMRAALDRADHPALLLVDAVSSLGSLPYEHAGWRVDVTIAASQKGLMAPPGLGLNVVSEKARQAAGGASLPKPYWDWRAIIEANRSGVFPYTPPTNLFFALDQALGLLAAEGMENVYARHARHGQACRRAVAAWGLETQCGATARPSDSLTAVRLPEGQDADRVRQIALAKFDISLGTGLGQLAGKIFRIGHLGDFNDAMLMGTLGGVELALKMAGVAIGKGGLAAGMEVLG